MVASCFPGVGFTTPCHPIATGLRESMLMLDISCAYLSIKDCKSQISQVKGKNKNVVASISHIPEQLEHG